MGGILMSEKLKKYVCKNPFTYLDIQPIGQWICCPSWAPTNIGGDAPPMQEDLLKDWQGSTVTDIRKSVLDGTYRHCDHKVCPSLSKLINTDEVPIEFIEKSEALKTFNITSLEDVENFQGLPEYILFGFDRSCNLKCPSCRNEQVPNDDVNSFAHKRKEYLLEQIETKFAANVKRLMITGSGDPFYSKLYRNYLIDFDPKKYPKLEEIQIITNGNLLNEKMWMSLGARKFIKRIEISVDAGTKDTYENITRLNGDWDRLISNIQYLSTQDSIEVFIVSMVVSEYNYKEMEDFYHTFNDIFSKSKIQLYIHYRQHVYWGTGAYSSAHVKAISVFEPEHEQHQQFLLELQKIHNKKTVSGATVGHNFHHLLNNT